MMVGNRKNMRKKYEWHFSIGIEEFFKNFKSPRWCSSLDSLWFSNYILYINSEIREEVYEEMKSIFLEVSVHWGITIQSSNKSCNLASNWVSGQPGQVKNYSFNFYQRLFNPLGNSTSIILLNFHILSVGMSNLNINQGKKKKKKTSFNIWHIFLFNVTSDISSLRKISSKQNLLKLDFFVN